VVEKSKPYDRSAPRQVSVEDPDAVFDGTYYIYPTTDGSDGWATSFSCMSSKDPLHLKNRRGFAAAWMSSGTENASPAIAFKNSKIFISSGGRSRGCDKPTAA
jgi:hypothetical protein